MNLQSNDFELFGIPARQQQDRAVLDQRTSRRLENALAGSALLVAHQATRQQKYDDRNIIRIIFFGKQNLQPPVGREILIRGEKQKAHSIIE